MTKEITVTIKIDGDNHRLEGIPAEAWEAFKTESKHHFPDKGDDAWAAYLSSVIMATINSSSYFMTDVPKENAKAISDILGEVGWEWENFHAYLLRAAVIPGALNFVAMHDDKQHFGTMIITGIRPSVFDKFKNITGHSIRKIFATMMIAAENGTITFDPNTTFVDAINEKSSKND